MITSLGCFFCKMTGNPVIFLDLTIFWFFTEALILSNWATGVEVAANRWVFGVGDVSIDDDAFVGGG